MIPVKLLSWVWKFLSFGITLPLWAFIGAYLYFQFAEADAVKRALSELVASAELEAARERERNLQIIIQEKNRREALLQGANDQFRTRLTEADQKFEGLSNEIDTLLARPVNDACVVDDAVLDLMHNAE